MTGKSLALQRPLELGQSSEFLVVVNHARDLLPHEHEGFVARPRVGEDSVPVLVHPLVVFNLKQLAQSLSSRTYIF